MKKHFKKLLLMALMAVMAVGLIACGTDKSDNESTKEEKTSVTITSLDASKNEIELEVPYNPKRIAILDLACLDIIDELGVGDRVVEWHQQVLITLKNIQMMHQLKILEQ